MRLALPILIAILGLASLPAPGQQVVSRYEPSKRQRTAIDTCHKDEVMDGAWCIKKCQPNFRLDEKARPPACIATKAGAVYTPPKSWQPKERSAAKPPPGA